jgi:hypothetical protein
VSNEKQADAYQNASEGFFPASLVCEGNLPISPHYCAIIEMIPESNATYQNCAFLQTAGGGFPLICPKCPYKRKSVCEALFQKEKRKLETCVGGKESGEVTSANAEKAAVQLSLKGPGDLEILYECMVSRGEGWEGNSSMDLMSHDSKRLYRVLISSHCMEMRKLRPGAEQNFAPSPRVKDN